jgi:amidase
MMRRFSILLLCCCAAAQDRRPSAPLRTFTVVEAGIRDMQTALRDRRVTSRELITQYLVRIATYEDQLNAVIYVNPRALHEADARDRERAKGKIRGPLHGIPIALKDNIHTADMPTTGGTLAFQGFVPPYDAKLTTKLRIAGAIIIAKTGMTELANWIASGMPNNYNALTGYAMNPYDPRRDPRDGMFDGRPVLNTGGSSSGVGTAANFWAANIGTETSGSILSPANQNMLVAIKPTVGRISRYGVIPITADQDTPGPMAKSVADAAILLGVMEGTTPDDIDSATTRCRPPAGNDYTRFLKADALKGARIGVPRAFFYERMVLPGGNTPRGGLDPDQKKVMDEVILILRARGAIVVDPADIPSVVETERAKNVLLFNPCAGEGGARGKDQNCSTVFKYGMKRDFNKWLGTLGPNAPVKTLSDLRRFNLARRSAGALKYDQAQLDISDEMDLDQDRARYETDVAKGIALAGAKGIDAAMKQHHLDAILFPAASGYSISATPGYPTVIVPFGFVPNTGPAPFPAGFDAKPSPFGVSFAGGACSEPQLIEIAYAFEQATKRRRPPLLFP